MSYTPPPYNAVNFDDGDLPYTPPAFNVVDFDDVEVAVEPYLPWIMFAATAPQ
jgi:hypothetical protein